MSYSIGLNSIYTFLWTKSNIKKRERKEKENTQQQQQQYNNKDYTKVIRLKSTFSAK